MIDRGVLRWSTEAMQRARRGPRVRGGRLGLRVGRSRASCTTATRSRCIDTDGTVLAERIDGGDMTEVDALLVAVRDAHRASRRHLAQAAARCSPA